MQQEDILKRKEAYVEAPTFRYINVGVYIVQKCNFNDEWLVEHRQIPVEDIHEKPLSWFDPYLGRYPRSDVKIAFAVVKGTKLWFLEDKNGVISLKNGDNYAAYVEDMDERTLISVHISVTSYKY